MEYNIFEFVVVVNSLLVMFLFDIFVPTSAPPLLFLSKWLVQYILKCQYCKYQRSVDYDTSWKSRFCFVLKEITSRLVDEDRMYCSLLQPYGCGLKFILYNYHVYSNTINYLNSYIINIFDPI